MKNNNQQIERILESIDDLQRSDAPHFFYTRLKARMDKGAVQKPLFFLRPAFLTAALVLLLACNIVTLVKKEKPATVPAEKATIDNFASEYHLSTSVYE